MDPGKLLSFGKEAFLRSVFLPLVFSTPLPSPYGFFTLQVCEFRFFLEERVRQIALFSVPKEPMDITAFNVFFLSYFFPCFSDPRRREGWFVDEVDSQSPPPGGSLFFDRDYSPVGYFSQRVDSDLFHHSLLL